MDEWRFRAKLPRGFQQMERAQRIHFEIEERDGRRLIVRGLRGGMDDQAGPQFPEEREDAFAVADIERVMTVSRDLPAETVEDPTGIAFGPKENRAMVAVNSSDFKPVAGEKDGHL